jgi:hypothetical protein
LDTYLHENTQDIFRPVGFLENVLEKLKIDEIVLKCSPKTGLEGQEGEWRGYI